MQHPILEQEPPLRSEPYVRRASPSYPQLPHVLEVLEHTSDCVALLDAAWRFTFLNGNARAVLGQGRDLIGAELHDVFASERGTKEWRQTQAAAKARSSTHFEFFASHLGLWFEVDIHPIPSGLQVYFRDVTDRKRRKRPSRHRKRRCGWPSRR
ncbi:MAG: PAS domain-containing protein [Pseudomonadota bacterium]|nr:PAS domain-containing protein [Pseudomonadota bacterium]